uniref:PIR Superfamily Protein n=1 Tax=Parastrongyloides trichosuri TaxID=131310 RepID=A0A0N4ZEE6_PARTI
MITSKIWYLFTYKDNDKHLRNKLYTYDERDVRETMVLIGGFFNNLFDRFAKYKNFEDVIDYCDMWIDLYYTFLKLERADSLHTGGVPNGDLQKKIIDRRNTL